MVQTGAPVQELLIEDACLLPHLDREEVKSESLALGGSRILAVGPKEELRRRFPQAQRLSLAGYLVTPGLINAHTHVSMSFFRGLGQAQPLRPDGSEQSMIEDFFFPAEKALTPDLIEALSYPYLVDALKSGSTACVDAYFFIEGVGHALERLGMRGFIGEHIADLGGPHPAGLPVWEKYRDLIDRWPFSSRVQPVVYAHAADTVSPGLLKTLGDFARTRHLPFHMHLSQTWGEYERVHRLYGKSPVRVAYDAGVLQPRSLLVHLVSADGDDLDRIQGEGAVAGLCPVSEIIYEELPKLELFFERKLRIALGTDCAASNDGADILAEARSMALFARQRGIRLPATALGRMALSEAAEVFAPRDLGALAAGRAADLVCIRIGAELLPMTRPLTNLFFSSAHRQVRHVMVDGRWVVWNRELTLVDEAALQQEFTAACLILRQRTQLPL
jgi:5-methylthioadenosine/S-adenosylhomocysteine deaminase